MTTAPNPASVMNSIKIKQYIIAVIQSGDNTHTQDQLMSSVSFSTTNITVKRVVKLIFIVCLLLLVWLAIHLILKESHNSVRLST